MQKEIAGHTIIFKEKLTFSDILSLGDYQKDIESGTIKQSDSIFLTMGILLESFDGLTGEEAITSIKNIDDNKVWGEVLSMYTESMQKIADFSKKKA